MAEIGQVLARLKGVQKQGPGHWMAFCPAHDNTKTQSLSVTEGSDGKILFKCFGQECEFEAIARALGFEPKELMGGNGVVPIRETVTVEALAQRTGLPLDFLERLGWRATKTGTAVAVPYRDTEGAFLYSKLRVSVSGSPKYKFPIGTQQVAYGLQHLRRFRQRGDTRLFLVEGETDAATLWHHKLPALGIPGSGAVNGTLRPIYLKGFQEVIAVRENDEAGAKFAQRVGEVCEEGGVEATVKILQLPEGTKDANDLFREDPEGFRTAFLSLAQEAEAWKRTEGTQYLISLADLAGPEDDLPSFLWNPYMPKGELILLAGQPGIGKSLATLALASALTRGWALPGGLSEATKISTLFLAGEDDPKRVLIPRAKQSNADLSKLFVVDRNTWPIDLWQEECLLDLSARIKATGVQLVIVDPIQAWVSEPRFNLNDAMHARRVMKGLKGVCDRAGATLVVVAHDRKGEVASAIDAVLGSRDFTASVRSVLMMFAHPAKKGYGILTHAKHNYSKAGPSLEYKVEDLSGRPQLIWGSASDLTAEDLVQEKQTGHDKTAAEDAETILKDLFSGTDKIEADTAIKEAKKQGISPWTMRRARKLLGYGLRKVGAKWFWLKVQREPGEDADEAASPVPF